MTKIYEAIIKWNKGIGKGAMVAFANAVGVSQPTVGRWCKGSPIDQWLRPKVAEVLGITIEALNEIAPPLIKGKGYQEVETDTDTVPVVGLISNADHFSADFDSEKYNEMEKIMMPNYSGGSNKGLKALRATGKVGNLAAEGDYIIVNPNADYKDGSIVVVKDKGGYALKSVFMDGKNAVLKSEEIKGKAVKVPASALNVIGVVRFVLMKMPLRHL